VEPGRLTHCRWRTVKIAASVTPQNTHGSAAEQVSAPWCPWCNEYMKLNDSSERNGVEVHRTVPTQMHPQE